MDRKGFTLIELIAVIVILALIALIVFPAINSVIHTSREDAYNNQIATIEKAAKQLSYENTFVLPDEVNDASTTIKLDCLLSGCTINGQKITGGYINEDDIVDPRNTKENLNGVILITYESNQYTYKYQESTSKNSIGGWLLDNDSSKAVLAANDGVYKGSNVSNYVNFSGSTWRILKINSDDTITLVKNSESTKLSWDNNSSTNFADSSINSYLNKTYYNSLSQKNLIKPTTQCVGPTGSECSQTYTSNVGLLTTNDYTEASNDISCNNNPACKNGNYLSTYSVSSGAEYTMTYQDNQIESISNGVLTTVNPNTVLNIRPVVTIKSTAKITGGSGKSNNPYTIG